MGRKLSEELKQGDLVAVALRGGAGWVQGELVWIKDDQMLLKHTDKALDKATPFVLIDLTEVTGIAMPREVEPQDKTSVAPGFLR